ncbi:cation-translocating P-type ATPase [Stackebrandtia nassauensis]|uniref:ATPase, P-type (Transporting), HAD superfamily, subfamily IC n=1 Tax=Stackebrandtia nassauensis (strain DSM 44728 / CIP 108903 / NRRL B-16338 / NBRC 102104 / LLR-40K-21) TaxID=446470 RepID=D3PXI8_STANL|nr:cation-transporting P-type ATPase [Stackebrandtia nassauensis]ADD43318.1 ATPase, P-type (transporting), HAD superfamily, subfamily IC [Stackebrandtia nassauensis DSM 44728]
MPTIVNSGLSTVEVAELRRRHGPNAVPETARRTLASRVVAQLRDPLILLLIAAMVVTIALGDVADTIVIVLVVVLNTTVGLIQEVRADNAVAALRQLAAPRARVVRDGVDQSVAAAELVPGDLVRLESGDIVPADATVTEAALCSVDESALTGESESVDKTVAQELLAGTVMATGRAQATVTRTGPHSALGRIEAVVAAQPRRDTPLQRRLAGLGRVLGAVAVGLSGVVLVLGLLRGLSLPDMVLSAVSLTVAAVPESLPAVVTIALALGAHRMARRAAIVRRLPAVETLGSVTVVASDKTGTLTEGRMSVRRLEAADGAVSVSGTGYAPSGEVSPRCSPGVRRLALAIALCNDADITPASNESWTPVGDPMEAALVAAAGRCGVDATVARSDHPRVDEIGFDAVRRRMLTVHKTPDDTFLVVCKGAPEVLLPDDAPSIRERAEELARDGFRVLAVAAAEHPTCPDASHYETGLRLLGLVALGDPLRQQAPRIRDRFDQAGIRLVMITGDHPHTAAAIATQLGFGPDPAVVTGDRLTPDPTGARVFARIRPEQKLDIVASLQGGGEIVAMTGDGVNDAPALRRADIGVAMGEGGTEAARQAADLVLADDNLATIGHAVEEGRRIYDNIRRFLAYALSGGLAEIAVMLAGPWFGLAIPLLPGQILWINMLTHGLPGVALGAEPVEDDAMRRPPRRPDQAILGDGLATRVAITGALITAVSLGAAVFAASRGLAWQSVLFTVLGMAQLGVAFVSRARTGRRDRVNWWLPAAVGLSVVFQLGALWIAPLRSLLGTSALSLPVVAGCVAVAAIPAAVLAVARLFRRAPRAGSRPPTAAASTRR